MLVQHQATLWKEYEADRSIVNRNNLVEAYAPLVHKIANNTSSKLATHVEHDDIVSYATLGIIQAIEKFDPSLNVKFTTYAYRRVFGSIIDELRQYDSVPRQIRTHSKEASKFVDDVESRGGKVNDQEIAEHIGVSIEKHRLNMALVPHVASLDYKVDAAADDSGSSLVYVDMIRPAENERLNASQIEYLTHGLIEALESLSEDSQILLWLYYNEDLNLGELARLFKFSESRISKMYWKSLADIYVSITS